MDSKAPERSSRHGNSNLKTFITSFSAAIVVGGGLAILAQALILAVSNLMGLGTTFLWMASGANAILALWAFAWTFARSWHVEQRLQEGLDVDEPKLSILANLGLSTRKR